MIELSGFSKSIVASVIRLISKQKGQFSPSSCLAILTYGGVSLFVVVFTVYPFAADVPADDIPKHLIPGPMRWAPSPSPWIRSREHRKCGTSFRRRSSTRRPQPPLGSALSGSFSFSFIGLAYLEWRRHRAFVKGEGYAENHITEPEPVSEEAL